MNATHQPPADSSATDSSATDSPALLRYIPTIAKRIDAMSHSERWRVYNRLKEEVYRDVCCEFVGRSGGEQEYYRRIRTLLSELHL